jgi:hypothetical protein
VDVDSFKGELLRKDFGYAYLRKNIDWTVAGGENR